MLPRGFPRQLNGGKPARPPRDPGAVLPHRARAASGPVEPGFFLRRSITLCRLFGQAFQAGFSDRRLAGSRRLEKFTKLNGQEGEANRKRNSPGPTAQTARTESSARREAATRSCTAAQFSREQHRNRTAASEISPSVSICPGQRSGSGKFTSRHSAQAGPGAQSQRK